MSIDRRRFVGSLAATAALPLTPFSVDASFAAAATEPFRLRYLLPSCMYGYAALEQVVPEVKKIGATAIDLWPKVHGNQREQLDEMGEEAFLALLRDHDVSLGCITQYPLGPFGLEEEIRLAGRLGCPTIVTGGKGPKGLRGSELKGAVRGFAEQLKPHLERAAEAGVTLAIENHGNNLIESPDSMKWLAEFRPADNLGIALAPYHLRQDEKFLSGLIRELGDAIVLFYAWQHGDGSTKRQSKQKELLQMPGRGPLDFKPLVAALHEIGFDGWTEIFMHPFPRGVPIRETTDEVTAEINRARTNLDAAVDSVRG